MMWTTFSNPLILKKQQLLTKAQMISRPVHCPSGVQIGFKDSHIIICPQRPPAKDADSLYHRLGGIFAIAKVVDMFSDMMRDDPLVGASSPNPQLRAWWANQSESRLAGLKFMRTLWLANVSGGPYQFVPTHPEPSLLNLENAHCPLKITSAEFQAAADVLQHAMEEANVRGKEQKEVLKAFQAHSGEVIADPSRACPFLARRR
jgi:hemoglobin